MRAFSYTRVENLLKATTEIEFNFSHVHTSDDFSLLKLIRRSIL